MSRNQARQSPLAYLIDLVAQIQRDASKPEVELHRRDRALAATGAWAVDDRVAVLRRWLDALRADSGERLPGRLVERVHGVQGASMAVLGLLCGWGAAASVFTYDGSRPVNTVHVLAVFVGAQLLLLIFLGIVLVPGRWASRVMGLGGLQDGLFWLSPGQLTRVVVRLLPASVRELLGRTFPMDDLRSGPLGNVAKWAMVHAAQVFGVAFYSGALATALYLIAFSDLAFSWSTTLQPRHDQIEHFTKVMSKPWGWLLPEAVPQAELIRDTHYYRQAGVRDTVTPERWGAWWPFLIAAMVTYGLLPRLGLWGLATWRFRVAVRRGFLNAPGASLVWDRLTSQWVSTQAEEEEKGRELPATPGLPVEGAAVPVVREFLVINWSGLELPDAGLTAHVAEAWRAQVAMVLHAGGRASVEADAGVVEAAASLPDSVGVAVFVKAWEPPVLEVTDFLSELRRAIGPQRVLVVCPVGWKASSGPVSPDEASARQWIRRVGTLHDRSSVVRPWPGGPAV